MTTLTGEVLGERTVLSFPQRAENLGSNHVRQLHTGRTDHATGYQTQLRFNLYPNLEHARNINHPPRPPPVVIERLPPQHISTQDKLEMAALLARRDFRNGRIPPKFLSTEQSESSSSSEEDEACEVGEKVVPLQPKPVQVIETAPSSIPLAKSLPDIKSKESDVEKMASEVVSLRRQLRRQVSRLRDAVLDKKASKISVKDEDDVERELRREDARSTRNMQSLYALQQQVQKLRLELDKHQNVSTTVRGTKKSLAMKQLAATHRSAIRLLHSFAGMPGRPAVYRQLSEMMQQLTLCCCQLGLDGAQLLELNDQIKALENEIVELNKNEEELTIVARLRQVQPVRKPTKAPLSQWHSNFISGQANIRTGHFRAQTFSSKMRRKAPLAKPNPKQLTSSQRSKHHKGVKGPSKFTSIPPPIQLRPLPAKRPVNPSGARQSIVPTHKNQKSKKRNHPAKKQHDGKQSHSDMHKGSEKDQEVLPFQSNDEDEKVSPNISDEDSVSVSESSTEDIVSLVNDAAMKDQLLSASTPVPAAPPKPSSYGYHGKTLNSSGDSIPRDLEMLQSLQEMLVKISHIEEEKMRIQQHWNQLTYCDASVKQVVRTPSPLPSSDATLSVSPSVLKSISHYRDRFHHHLKLKGAITGLDWESSKLIEELSEEILDEIVDSTVNEVDQLCEQYAHNIFASEFAVPNANI